MKHMKTKTLTAVLCAFTMLFTQSVTLAYADDGAAVPGSSQIGNDIDDTALNDENETELIEIDPDAHTHQWDEGEVTTPATCAEEGVITYTCTLCGETKEEPVEKTDSHQYGTGEVIKEATCQEQGEIEYTCKICGDSYTEKTDKLSHQLDEGKVVKEPTCVDTGVATYVCKLCGSTFEQQIPVDDTAHEWDDGKVTKQPGCSKTGVRTYTCKLCGETKTSLIAATGEHSYDSGKVTAEATCGKEGTKVYTCSECGRTKTETIPATGKHYFGKPEILKEADCTHAGLRHFVCSGCGYEVDTLIPKSAVHSFDSGVITKAPTVKASGIKTYTCKLCGKTLEKKIPKLINVSSLKISLLSSTTYTGEPIRPSVTVKNGSTVLKNNTDYYLVYTDNVKPGKATVFIYGKGGYTGSVSKTFTIKAASIANAAVTLPDKIYTYTGSAVKPAVTVKLGSKLIKGTDYTVKYKNNKSIGKATVIITGKGGYTGQKEVSFNIFPKAVKISSLTSPSAKKLKVKWSKNTTSGGYEIVYSTSKSFSSAHKVKVTGKNKVSKTISSLRSGKTYYVKVRAFRRVGNANYWSLYSAVKKIKVK